MTAPFLFPLNHIMFCPLCRAEYREGFYRCADCDVELVPHGGGRAGDGTSPEAAFEQIYSSNNGSQFELVKEALRDAGIPFREATQDAGLLYSSLLKPWYRIWISPADTTPALAVLEELFGSESDLQELSAVETGEQLAPDLPARESQERARFDPYEGPIEIPEMTHELWSGSDPFFAWFLSAALSENGIRSRTVSDGDKRYRVLVDPADVPRATVIMQAIESCEPPTVAGA